MNAVIPPRKSRKVQREYDKDIYKLRHLVENAFLHLKRWRGIATRYAKNTASFLAATHIRHAIRAFADRLLAAGKPRMVVIVAAMRKLFCLAYAVVRSGQPFRRLNPS